MWKIQAIPPQVKVSLHLKLGPRNLHKECAHPNGWRDKHTKKDYFDFGADPPPPFGVFHNLEHFQFWLVPLDKSLGIGFQQIWLLVPEE